MLPGETHLRKHLKAYFVETNGWRSFVKSCFQNPMLVTRSFFWSYPPPKNHISVSPRHQVSQVSFRIKNQDTLFSFFFFNRCNICEENVSQGNFLRQFCGSPDINLINCLKRFGPSFKNPILLFTSFTPPGISGINGTTVTVFYLLSELE